ncbi:MAG: hypothetical protein WCP34_08555, partial [Pseudomonadota bacterium]
RALFWRVSQGWYQFNPRLSVRRKQGDAEVWVPVYQALNLPFIDEFALSYYWPRIDEYLVKAGLPACKTPIAAERAIMTWQAAAHSQTRRYGGLIS